MAQINKNRRHFGAKYLGIITDHGLTCKNQVDEVYKKCFLRLRNDSHPTFSRMFRSPIKQLWTLWNTALRLTCYIPFQSMLDVGQSKRLLLNLLRRLASVANVNSKMYAVNFADQGNSQGAFSLVMRISRSVDRPLRPEIPKTIEQRNDPVTRNGIHYPKARTSVSKIIFAFVPVKEGVFINDLHWI